MSSDTDKVVRAWLDSRRLVSQKTIEEYMDACEQDLLYAMEWKGERALYASIRLKEIAQIEDMIEYQKDYAAIIKEYQKALQRYALYPSNSTSAMANLSHQAKTSVLAEIVQELTELTR